MLALIPGSNVHLRVKTAGSEHLGALLVCRGSDPKHIERRRSGINVMIVLEPGFLDQGSCNDKAE